MGRSELSCKVARNLNGTASAGHDARRARMGWSLGACNLDAYRDPGLNLCPHVLQLDWRCVRKGEVRIVRHGRRVGTAQISDTSRADHQ